MAKQKNKITNVNNNVVVNSTDTQQTGSAISEASKMQNSEFSSDDFLRENWLTPAYVNDESDPENGRMFLGYYKYRLPFPTFEDVEEAAEYVMSHPVPVTLAIISCIESLKIEQNEKQIQTEGSL